MRSLFNKIFNNKKTKFSKSQSYHAYMYDKLEPSWSKRDYGEFAREAYAKNVIANRCINLIAQGAASVPWQLFKQKKNLIEIKNHPLLDLLKQPNPGSGGAEFFERLFSYRLLSGNAYILSLGAAQPLELHLLRPDRVTIVNGEANMPKGYLYNIMAAEGAKTVF